MQPLPHIINQLEQLRADFYLELNHQQATASGDSTLWAALQRAQYRNIEQHTARIEDAIQALQHINHL